MHTEYVNLLHEQGRARQFDPLFSIRFTLFQLLTILFLFLCRLIFSIIIELAPKQVRVNSVNPGPVQTNILMANNVSKSKEHDNKLWQTEKKVQPTNRLATVEEVAYTIAYLASDQSSFVTGEFVHVAGGVQLV